jgi:hypothetical protein
LPSPTSDSPTQRPLIFAIAISSQGIYNARKAFAAFVVQLNAYPCLSASSGVCRTG